MSRKLPRGFTLVEVLVALAITAIALMAGAQATGALMLNAARQSEVLLAHLCAENALVTVRLSRDGSSVTGRGADPDTLVASAKAYLVALNKLIARGGRLHAQAAE